MPQRRSPLQTRRPRDLPVAAVRARRLARGRRRHRADADHDRRARDVRRGRALGTSSRTTRSSRRERSTAAPRPGRTCAASEEQRRACCSRPARPSAATVDCRPASVRVPRSCTGPRARRDDLHELVVGLGYQCVRSGARARADTSDSCRSFCADDDVFRLERKRLAHKERACATPGQRRRVVSWSTCDAGAERAGAVRRGRQRRPPLPRRPVDGADAQLDPRTRRRTVGAPSSTTWRPASSRWR